MALHLLVTTNLNRRIVHDVDFGTLLKLSHDQALILDHSAMQFFGSGLPSRKLIVVGHEPPHVSVDHVVDTVDQAIECYRDLKERDAVALGFTRHFNKRILPYIDVLHHHTIDCTKNRQQQLFPRLSDRQWEPLYMERCPAKPLGRSISVTKRTFNRKV